MATIDYRNTGIVTKPVSVKAVADLLNSSGVGKTAAYNDNVCTNERINKWSKRKPVKDERVLTVFSDAFFQQSTSSNNIIWGMQVSQIDGNSAKTAWDLYDDDESNEVNWKYLRPVYTDAHRLGDFVGYYHKAEQLCKSVDFEYDGSYRIEEVRISTESTSTDKLRFFVNGVLKTDKGGISFSDLNYLKSGENCYLVLCANVFANSPDTLVGEYINNNIKLYTDTSKSTLDTNTERNDIEYDEQYDRHKLVEVALDINNTNTTNTFYIVLTLDIVKYVDGQWKRERKIAIPYSNDNYWIKQIDVVRIQRSIQVYKVWNKSNDRTSDDAFTSYNNAITAGFDYFRNPLIWFKVSKTSESITFARLSGNEIGYVLRTKYYDTTTGTYHTSTGDLTTQTGDNRPQTVTISAGSTSGTEDIFFQFSDMWGINDVNKVQSGHIYVADLYLAKKTAPNVIESEILVGHVELKMQK